MPYFVNYGDTCEEYVAKRVREIRIKRGFTIPKLARVCGIPYARIRKIEIGAGYVYLREVEDVLKACGMKMTIIVTEDEYWKPDEAALVSMRKGGRIAREEENIVTYEYDTKKGGEND